MLAFKKTEGLTNEEIHQYLEGLVENGATPSFGVKGFSSDKYPVTVVPQRYNYVGIDIHGKTNFGMTVLNFAKADDIIQLMEVEANARELLQIIASDSSLQNTLVSVKEFAKSLEL